MSPTTATDPSPVTDTSQESAIVLIADKFDATGIEELENLGVVAGDPGLDPSPSRRDRRTRSARPDRARPE